VYFDYVATFDQKATTDRADNVATLLRHGIGNSSTA
jgi:hypothetical protein